MELLEMHFEALSMVFWGSESEDTPSFSWSPVTNAMIFLADSAAELVVTKDMTYADTVDTIISEGYTIVKASE